MNLPKRGVFGHHVLVRSRRQLWTSADHPLRQIESPPRSDIARYPYLQITQTESEQSTRRCWEAKHVKPQVAFRTDSMEALRGLIADGFGVTILSDMVYRPWSLEGRPIAARPILDAVPDMKVGLVWKPGPSIGNLARALQQFLIQAPGR